MVPRPGHRAPKSEAMASSTFECGNLSGSIEPASRSRGTLIVNTRIVTVDARLSALSGQSVRLVHENCGSRIRLRCSLGCSDKVLEF